MCLDGAALTPGGALGEDLLTLGVGSDETNDEFQWHLMQIGWQTIVPRVCC